MMTPAQLAVLVSAGKLLSQIKSADRRVDNAVALLRDAWRAARGLPVGEQRTTALPSAWRRPAMPAAPLTPPSVAASPAAVHSQVGAVCRPVRRTKTQRD